MLIAPNPANEYLEVRFSPSDENIKEAIPTYELQLYNDQQQLVKNVRATNSPISKMDIRDLTSGMYYLNIITPKATEKKHILIE